MTEPKWIWTSEHSIPSEVEAGRDILQELLDQLKQSGWPEHDVFGVHLSAEEALVNAIRHGNRLDPKKAVQVTCQLSDRLLRIRIADEGDGFNLEDVPDPTDPEQLEAPSGRGIMLMRSFMSRLEFNEKGNVVIMEKDRTTEP